MKLSKYRKFVLQKNLRYGGEKLWERRSKSDFVLKLITNSFILGRSIEKTQQKSASPESSVNEPNTPEDKPDFGQMESVSGFQGQTPAKEPDRSPSPFPPELSFGNWDPLEQGVRGNFRSGSFIFLVSNYSV